MAMLNTHPVSSSPGSLYVHARNKFNLWTMFMIDITIPMVDNITIPMVDITIPNHTVTGPGSAVSLNTTFKLEARYELVLWTRQPKKEVWHSCSIF